MLQMAKTGDKMRQIALIGSWGTDIQGTTKPGEGEGGVASFNVEEDGLKIINRVVPSVNAGGLCVSADNHFAYSTDERKDRDGHHGSGGGVCAYRISDEGEVIFLNSVSSAGAYPAYCTVDSQRRFVFAVNHGNHEEVVSRSIRNSDGTYGCERVYDEGSVGMFPILQDGTLGPCRELKGFKGHGTLEFYQWTSHPHSVILDPSERYLLVGDKGCDLIRIFRVDFENAILTELPAGEVPSGAGARHLVFHTKLPILYCNGEEGNTVNVFSFNHETGKLRLIQTISTLPEEFRPKDDPDDPFAEGATADMRIHPSGKALYVGNRGDDSIACYNINEKGILKLIEIVPCGGKIPRAMNLDRFGKFLYSVNQRSGNVVEFSINPNTLRITPSGNVLSVNNPASIQFILVTS